MNLFRRLFRKTLPPPPVRTMELSEVVQEMRRKNLSNVELSVISAQVTHNAQFTHNGTPLRFVVSIEVLPFDGEVERVEVKTLPEGDEHSQTTTTVIPLSRLKASAETNDLQQRIIAALEANETEMEE